MIAFIELSYIWQTYPHLWGYSVLSSLRDFHCDRIRNTYNGPLFTGMSFLTPLAPNAPCFISFFALHLSPGDTVLQSLPFSFGRSIRFVPHSLAHLICTFSSIIFISSSVPFSLCLCLCAIPFRLLPLWATLQTSLLSSFNPHVQFSFDICRTHQHWSPRGLPTFQHQFWSCCWSSLVAPPAIPIVPFGYKKHVVFVML